MPPKRKKNDPTVDSASVNKVRKTSKKSTLNGDSKAVKLETSDKAPVEAVAKFEPKNEIGQEKLKSGKMSKVRKTSKKSTLNGDSKAVKLETSDKAPVEAVAKFEPKNEIGQEKLKSGKMSKEWMTRAATALKSAQVAQKVAASPKLIGAHISIAGGFDKSPLSAADSGCKAFGLFLRSQRTWKLNPSDLTNNKKFDEFRKNCNEVSISLNHILPHGSYLLNAGAPDNETLEKTRQTLLHEVQMCEKMGLTLYNFHPGSSCGKITTEKCLQLIAETVNWLISQTSHVVIVLETMAKQGYTVGGTFEELKCLIDMIKDKERVGVCLDTCHVFAAGYDIRKEKGYERTMAEFDRVVGLKYLKAIHLNDSKGKLGSKLDRHENIGRGELGADCFRVIMNDKRLNDIPIILETPMNVSDADEIALLYSL